LAGDRRLVGERLHQSDLAVSERSDLIALDADRPQQLVSPEHGHRQQAAEGQLSGSVGILGVTPNIVNVDCAALQNGPPRAALASGGYRVAFEKVLVLRGEITGDHGSQHLTIESEDRRLLRLAQPYRALRQLLHNRLQIERGPADHLQKLAGGSLLLERY